MNERARDLIAEIIAQLHELYWRSTRKDHAVGLERVEDLLGRLRELEGSAAASGARRSGGGRRLPGIVTTDDEPSLLEQVSSELEEAAELRIASAFLSGGDTNPIIKPLRALTGGRRAVPVRILTSVMGFINRPDALRAFRNWPGVELRLYHERPGAPQELLTGHSRGFHAKTMLIRKRGPPHTVLVGSANLTGAGLEGNVEWNYLSDFEVNVGLGEQPSPYDRAEALFDEIWEHRSFQPDQDFLQAYEEIFNRGRSLRRQLNRLGADLPAPAPGAVDDRDTETSVPAVTPRPAQQQALKAMAGMRAGGSTRYAVIAATGIGKTMLSAFDVVNTGARRVLFLAHRRHILEQAARDYARVTGEDARRVILQGRDSAAELAGERLQVFAMVWTLGNEEVLERLPRDFFEYIVLDEFHHAAADTYRRVLRHFKPRYLLGMTATPERTDGQDVLELCDRNIAYELRLLEAVDRGWLAPFQYYALYDPTDYDQVRWTGLGYDEEELQHHLSTDTRADLIVRNLAVYQPALESRAAIAFCSNVGHARWMARAFRARGLEAAPLTGQTPEEERAALIRRLQDPEDALEILCTVDVLGEGVDMPSITHILLLRPTHSFAVFLQQLGRGLRPAPGKSFVVVLDFVGNYRKRFVAPLALAGHSTVPDRLPRVDRPGAFKLPKSCHVDADAQVRRIWQDELTAIDPRTRRIEPIRTALEELAGTDRLLAEVGLAELFVFAPSGQDLPGRIRSIGGWLRVRHELDLAVEYETRVLNTPGETLLRHVEEELKPNKSYKMAVLHTLLDLADRDGPGARVEWPVDEIARGFLQYYLVNRRRTEDYTDLKNHVEKGGDPRQYPLSKVAAHLKNMPLDKLSNSPDKPFILDKDRNVFFLKEPYHRYWRDPDFRALIRERVEYAEARYWNGR